MLLLGVVVVIVVVGTRAGYAEAIRSAGSGPPVPAVVLLRRQWSKCVAQRLLMDFMHISFLLHSFRAATIEAASHVWTGPSAATCRFRDLRFQGVARCPPYDMAAQARGFPRVFQFCMYPTGTRSSRGGIRLYS